MSLSKRKKGLRSLSIILILILSFNLLIHKGYSSSENFETYTEVDPKAKLWRNSTTVNWTIYRRNDTGRFYKSYGVDYFVDFEHWFIMDFSIIEAGDIDNRAFIEPYILSTENDRGGTSNDTRLQLVQVGLLDNVYRVRFRQRSGGAVQFDNQSITIANIDPVYCVMNKTGTAWRFDGYSSSVLRDAGGNGDLVDYDQTGNNDTYEFIILSRGINSGNDPADYSSGWLQHLDFRTWRTLIFYHTSGGLLRVDSSSMANTTTTNFINGTIIELSALVEGNNTYTFSNFTWNGFSNISNPSNLLLTQNYSVWCYFNVAVTGAPADTSTYISLGAFGFFMAVIVLVIRMIWTSGKEEESFLE